MKFLICYTEIMKNILKYGIIALVGVAVFVAALGLTGFNSDEKNVDVESSNGVIVEKTTSEEHQNIICFGERTFHQFNEQDPGGYSYSILVFDITNSDEIEGYMKYYPYGTDSGVGSFSGTYNMETSIIQGAMSAYGEGASYVDARIWRLEEGRLVHGYHKDELLGLEPDYSDLSVIVWSTEYPNLEVDCAQVKAWESELHAKWDSFYDATDVERLGDILSGAIPVDASSVTERYVDLDSNWKTEETFFYIDHSDYCDATGCTLLIVNKDNSIMQTITSVRTPIYASVYEQSRKWRDIVIQTDEGYRLLQHNGTSFSLDFDSTSLLSERDVTWHPERYFPAIR